jgi:hypothetical protein
MSPSSDKRDLQAQVCLLNTAFLSNRQHDNCLSFSIGTSPIMDRIYNFVCFSYILTRMSWSTFLLSLSEIPNSHLAQKMTIQLRLLVVFLGST